MSARGTGTSSSHSCTLLRVGARPAGLSRCDRWTLFCLPGSPEEPASVTSRRSRSPPIPIAAAICRSPAAQFNASFLASRCAHAKKNPLHYAEFGIVAILSHLELPNEPPLNSPARGPPQGDLLLDQTSAFDPTEAEPIPEFVFDPSVPDTFDD